MAMIKKSNPINIAPFVDVLLVIFVILVVAARFDGPGKDELQKLNMIINDQKNKIATLEEKGSKNRTLPTSRAVVINETIVDEDREKIEVLNSQIKGLKDALEKAKKASSSNLEKPGGGASANIMFSADGKITVNGKQVSEQFVYSLLETIHPDMRVGWKGHGNEAAYQLEEYAKTLGYEFE